LVPITELDMHGLEKIKKDDKWIKYVSILLNLTDDVMLDRIKMRWGIDQEEINRRLASAKIERGLAKTYCDYILDTSDTLANNIKNINQLVKKILNG